MGPRTTPLYFAGTGRLMREQLREIKASASSLQETQLSRACKVALKRRERGELHAERCKSGRGHGEARTWKSGDFVCGRELDGDSEGSHGPEKQHEVDRAVEDGQCVMSARYEVSILDIARPAKTKGTAKEFEVVDTVQRVIALDDEESYLFRG
ncbi:hypothetical protein A0H81_12214 [Grifola frondosa]|uniref:Uncharacterized protein n=1 Tax=Grifola frondosa TaxID=5627 RepID=A0A1C7LTQ1_GRIFR|nr:hypothetical protein A0H81_12214 [Grifola frondosa]